MSPVPVWARPLRTLASLTAGVLLFATIASYAVSTGLGGGGRGALLAPGVGAERGTSSQAAPAAAPAASRAAAGAPAPSAQGFSVTAPKLAQDSANAPSTAAASAAPGSSAAATSNVNALSRAEPVARPNEIGPSPLLWLGLAILAVAVAWFAHRRATRA